MQDVHNGGWRCEVTPDQLMVSEFQVSVLHEPSHVDMFPQTNTVNRYILNSQFLSKLVIQNISPR